MKRGRRAVSALACALSALATAGCGGDDGDGEAPAAKSAKERRTTLERLDVQRIAARVQKLRRLEYRAIPKLLVVTKEQAARHAKREVRSVGIQRVDEEVAKLLGVIPPDVTALQIAESRSDAVLGYYEGEPARVALVVGPAADDPRTAEAVLAHELVHGLDDQRFGAFGRAKRLEAGSSDRSSAYGALVEGDARLLEGSYADEFGALATVGGDADTERALERLPFAVFLQAAFTYDSGAEFVEFLVERGKGYELVDRAFESRPPVSTAQILHPEQYLAGKQPRPVRVSPGPILGDGWNRVVSTTLGELEVLQLLAFDEDDAEEYEDATEGWAGGRIELWRKGSFDPEACPAPCRERDAAILGLRWDAFEDAGEFARAFKDSLESNQQAKPARGEGTFRVKGAGVAIDSGADRTTVAYAPTPELAARLAKRAGK